MQSLTDEIVQNAIEAANTDGALPAIIQTRSCMSADVAPPLHAKTELGGNANSMELIDDRLAPPIFKNVLTEFVSILTLAIAPGLNVSPCPFPRLTTIGDECWERQHRTSFNWTRLVH